MSNLAILPIPTVELVVTHFITEFTALNRSLLSVQLPNIISNSTRNWFFFYYLQTILPIETSKKKYENIEEVREALTGEIGICLENENIEIRSKLKIIENAEKRTNRPDGCSISFGQISSLVYISVQIIGLPLQSTSDHLTPASVPIFSEKISFSAILSILVLKILNKKSQNYQHIKYSLSHSIYFIFLTLISNILNIHFSINTLDPSLDRKFARYQIMTHYDSCHLLSVIMSHFE